MGERVRSDLEQRIVDAGIELLRRGESIGIKRIAKEVGKSQQAVYIYYEDGLPEIQAAVATKGFELLADDMERDLDADQNATPQLESIARAYIGFADSNPGLFRLMFGGGGAARLDVRGLLGARLRAQLVIERAVDQAQRAGAVREGDSLELSVMGWALIHGVTVLHVEKQPFFEGGARSVDLLARRATEIFLRGVRP